ncbi:alpha-fibrinogenase isoform X2 [Drosophila willistoni]|nr:alpha-fibrinogenase isoform X2 [Drosophila willistoni]
MVDKRRLIIAKNLSPIGDEDLIRVDKMVVYPLYERNKQDDVAIIKLTKSLKIDQKFIEKAKIGRNDLKIDADCYSVGWRSFIGKRKPMSKWLYAVKVKLYRFCQCLQTDEKRSSDIDMDAMDYLICVNSTESDSCLTDFGGPIFCENQLYGLTLGNAKCLNSSVPIFFTYVPYYNGWINKMITSSQATRQTAAASLPILIVFLLGNFHFGK